MTDDSLSDSDLQDINSDHDADHNHEHNADHDHDHDDDTDNENSLNSDSDSIASDYIEEDTAMAVEADNTFDTVLDSMIFPGMYCEGYLEAVVKHWASTNPSLRRIYLSFGDDEGTNIHDGMGNFGCRYRMMKMPCGEWKHVNALYWSPVYSGFSEGCYHPFDDLPGVLEEDADFFC